jgi:gas vesicle protein
MDTEESRGKSSTEMTSTDGTRRPTGFSAGLLLGVVIGASIALLFAPERGEKTRGRLRRRVRSLGDDAREGLDRAGSRTRRELLRRKRRLGAELERVKERAKDALD